MPIRIVYASQVCPGIGQLEINALVMWSDHYNREHYITGVLAFDGFQVIQILEGKDLIVEPLFDRIRLDRRHEGVVLLCHEEINRIHFPAWQMVRRSIIDVLMLVESVRLPAAGILTEF